MSFLEVCIAESVSLAHLRFFHRRQNVQLVPRSLREPLYPQEMLPPQTGLGRKERVKNIRDAFSVKNRGKIDGKKLLLVDDVLTTGATINECARVLRAAGAERVDVLTLARA